MRRSLITTVAAVVAVVLLAMLVPMAVLVRSYALEDRLSRASLEVQATESVVSGQDKGAVAVYLDEVNRGGATRTSVLYPDGTGIGPDPGEDARVAQARTSGRARVDDVPGGVQVLVPVFRNASKPWYWAPSAEVSKVAFVPPPSAKVSVVDVVATTLPVMTDPA